MRGKFTFNITLKTINNISAINLLEKKDEAFYVTWELKSKKQKQSGALQPFKINAQTGRGLKVDVDQAFDLSVDFIEENKSRMLSFTVKEGLKGKPIIILELDLNQFHSAESVDKQMEIPIMKTPTVDNCKKLMGTSIKLDIMGVYMGEAKQSASSGVRASIRDIRNTILRGHAGEKGEATTTHGGDSHASQLEMKKIQEQFAVKEEEHKHEVFKKDMEIARLSQHLKNVEEKMQKMQEQLSEFEKQKEEHHSVASEDDEEHPAENNELEEIDDIMNSILEGNKSEPNDNENHDDEGYEPVDETMKALLSGQGAAPAPVVPQLNLESSNNENLKQQLAEKAEELESMRKLYDTHRELASSKASEAESALATKVKLEQEVAGLHTKVDKLSQDLKTSQQEYNTIKFQLDHHNEQKAVLQQSQAESIKKIQDLQQVVEDLKAENLTKQKELQKLQVEAQHFDEEVKKVKEELTSKNSQISELELKLLASSVPAGAEGSTSANVDIMRNYQDKIKTYEAEIEESRKQLVKLRAELSEARHDASVNGEKATTLSQKVKTLEADQETKARNIEDLTVKLTLLEFDKKASELQVVDQKGQIEALLETKNKLQMTVKELEYKIQVSDVQLRKSKEEYIDRRVFEEQQQELNRIREKLRILTQPRRAEEPVPTIEATEFKMMPLKQIILDPLGGLKYSLKLLAVYFEKKVSQHMSWSGENVEELSKKKRIWKLCGDSSKNPVLADIINNQFLESLRAIFAHNFQEPYWFTYAHHWHVIQEISDALAYELRWKKAGSFTPQDAFAQAFVEAAQWSTTISDAAYYDITKKQQQIPYSLEEVRFRTFILVFLDRAQISQLMELITSQTKIIEKFYKKGAIIRDRAALNQTVFKFLLLAQKLPLYMEPISHVDNRIALIETKLQKKQTPPSSSVPAPEATANNAGSNTATPRGTGAAAAPESQLDLRALSDELTMHAATQNYIPVPPPAPHEL